MDPLRDDDAALFTLHFLVAAGAAGLKIIPGDINLLAVQQAADAGHQQIHVHAVGGFPVRGLRRTLIQRQEEVIHAQQAYRHAQIFQIVLQTHGGRGLAAARGAGQRHDGAVAGENGG